MALIMMDAAPICDEVSIVAEIDDALTQLIVFQRKVKVKHARQYPEDQKTHQKTHLDALKTYFYMECKQVISAHPDVFNRLCEEPDFTEQIAFHQLEPYVDFALHGKYGACKSEDYPLDKGTAMLQQKYQVLWRGTFTCDVHLSR